MDNQPNGLHDYFELLFSKLNTGLVLLDSEGMILKLTGIAEVILGKTADGLKGQNIFKLLKNPSTENSLIPHSILQGFSIENHKIHWNNDEYAYELLIDVYPIANVHDEIESILMFINDVSDVFSTQRQLERNEHLAVIGQMAAGTAHEIRNPLTSIKGLIQMLKKSLEEKNMYKEMHYANIMIKEIDRINDLVGEFLLISRTRETRSIIFYLDDLMVQLLPIIHSDALLNGIDLKTGDFGNLPAVHASPELLKQVFLNLSKNAFEAMDSPGELRIEASTTCREGMITIHFKDTGPGIPESIRDKIFDPFFTTKPDGTGLGLSICQRIVEDMGGELHITSNEQGSILSVSIPHVK